MVYDIDPAVSGPGVYQVNQTMSTSIQPGYIQFLGVLFYLELVFAAQLYLFCVLYAPSILALFSNFNFFVFVSNSILFSSSMIRTSFVTFFLLSLLFPRIPTVSELFLGSLGISNQ